MAKRETHFIGRRWREDLRCWSFSWSVSKIPTEPKTGIKYIDVPDKYGNTALFLVCIRLDKSDFMQAKYLLDAGASVDVVKISDAMTVLHWAAHHGKQELVHELLMHQKKKEKEREKEKKQNPTRTKRRLLCWNDVHKSVHYVEAQHKRKTRKPLIVAAVVG
jgi:hypothetical protein